MRRVFQLCVVLMLVAELVLWHAGTQLSWILAGLQIFFIGFNVMEALLPSLISKEAPTGCKGTAMGVYSTSQFIGVAIGGSLGGALYGSGGALLVFIGCSLVALLWLGVSLTMAEPPYVSSLRIELPDGLVVSPELERSLARCAGVSDVLLLPEERSVYIKVDIRQTNREQLEQLLFVR
jgi:MFS family permease